MNTMKLYILSLIFCLLALTSVWAAPPLPAQKGKSVAADAEKVPVEAPEVPAPKTVSPVLDVNLMTGLTSSLPAGITWHSALTSGSGECTCDRQGVLKLTVEDGMGVEVNMTFSHSDGYTFNIGDSATNNAWAGDSSTQQNDAEVLSYHQSLYVYGRDNPAGGSYGLLHSQANFVAINPYTTLTLRLADELFTANNGLHFLYLNSHKLYALRGQSDLSSGGVNNDVYLAMNRVVASSGRSGSGLCRVSVRFYQLAP